MIEDRFWSKVDRNGLGGCWNWTAFVEPYGYGMFWINGKNRRAHRVAYELAIGPVPAGLDVDHLCRNRICVNPKHLEAVTRSENVKRGLPGIAKRSQTHCVNGHPFDEANTYWWRGGRICKTCRARLQREMRARRKSGTSRLTGAAGWLKNGPAGGRVEVQFIAPQMRFVA